MHDNIWSCGKNDLQEKITLGKGFYRGRGERADSDNIPAMRELGRLSHR